jgi:hypothetical protein
MNRDRCQTAASKPGPADQRLQRWIMEFLDFGREYMILFRIFDRSGLRQQLSEEERNRNTHQDIHQIRTILAEGIREKVFRKMEPLMMARILFTCMIGSVITQPILNDLSSEQLSKELMRLFIV